MSDAVTAFTLGIAFEELADLEEKHHEDRLGELCLCTRQEANAECTDGCHRHEEMLVEGIAVGHALYGFVKCFVSDEQIGYEINKEQLPCGQLAVLLDDDGCYEKYYRNGDERELAFQTAVLMFVMVMRAATTVLVMFV